MMTVPALLTALGGPSKVAEACGISASAVCNWASRGAVAADHRLTVWRLASEAGLDWAPPGAEGMALVAKEAAA